jgi:hypothetical protein
VSSEVKKFVDVRAYGQCSRCHRYELLQAIFNDTLSEIILVCDRCLNCPMDAEAMDLIFEKADVPHPDRSRTMQGLVEAEQRRMFELQRIWPEDGVWPQD